MFHTYKQIYLYDQTQRTTVLWLIYEENNEKGEESKKEMIFLNAHFVLGTELPNPMNTDILRIVADGNKNFD